MSTIIQVADGVVSELNGHTFTQALAAVRYYKPVFDLKDMKDLHVSVVPKGMEMSMAGRGLAQSDVQIDIGVQKKLATGELAETDTLMNLVDEIADFLRQRKLAAAPSAAWVSVENSPVYDPDHMDQLRQFTSVLTLTYRVMR